MKQHADKNKMQNTLSKGQNQMPKLDQLRLVAQRLSRLPQITRSRGYRLYGKNGKRYVDLYRENGRMLLGHRPQSLIRILKNTLERGLVSGLPSIYTPRLEKELRRIFPAYKTFVAFNSMDTALAQASLFLEETLAEDSIIDPLFAKVREAKGNLKTPDKSGLRISFWRPFSPSNLETEILVPLLPGGIAGELVILCFKKLEQNTTLATACHLSPLLLASILHALGLLSREKLPSWASTPIASEANIFAQQGIYLVPECEEQTYDKVFNLFLSNGFLLAPSASLPSILPLQMSDGELCKLKHTISLT
ncbi:MAG: aminotransferase class III-fold pyridoxal phosphate-dependent enzyme [Spirochaetaceae bacterium]|nr:MAG: aminotransferase class III-fold pyridoxal phosphate-dependent enzyme [Spirochaetaceae bacterium]